MRRGTGQRGLITSVERIANWNFGPRPGGAEKAAVSGSVALQLDPWYPAPVCRMRQRLRGRAARRIAGARVRAP